MFTMSFRVNLAPLNKFQRLYEQGMGSQGWGPVRRGVEKMTDVYMTSMYERFNRFSMGGGTWAPLADITIKRKQHESILVDTDTLRTSLNPRNRARSGLISGGRNGFRVGIPDGIRHPKSKLTVSQLASVHQLGKGRSGQNLPARPILVEPDTLTRSRMSRALADGLKTALRESGA